jgi:hypothetical protein
MSDGDDQQAQEGVIRSHVDLAEAAANGSRAMVCERSTICTEYERF